jgi:predicted dehydrogenase
LNPPDTKIRLGLVGLGKMGLSHLSIFRAHPEIDVVAACDSSSVVRNVLKKYADLRMFGDFDAMLAEAELDAVVIATPSESHAGFVRAALGRGLHVFCEKPFTLDASESTELARLGEERGLVTQVGYHNRFVGPFREVRALIDAGAIGEITHGLVEAYGPVVLKPQGGTWRSRRNAGGGCLYDYAAHAIDLMIWYLGEPQGVGGTILNQVFSSEIDDEVSSTIYFSGGTSGQVSANWSDESQRKMSTRITLWGTKGRIFADRQECQVYLRSTSTPPDGYRTGWNVKYTTELSEDVWFYLRGEEYSAQADAFVRRVRDQDLGGLNSFSSARVTDAVISMMVADARSGARTTGSNSDETVDKRAPARRGWIRRRSAAT